jgi:hypothetical protein
MQTIIIQAYKICIPISESCIIPAFNTPKFCKPKYLFGPCGNVFLLS